MRRVLVFTFLASLAALPQLHAQQPFFTDDANTVAYRRWHLETNNEYDVLPHSSHPNLRQDTQTIKFSYGLFHNCEVGMDFPYSPSSTRAVPNSATRSAWATQISPSSTTFVKRRPDLDCPGSPPV